MQCKFWRSAQTKISWNATSSWRLPTTSTWSTITSKVFLSQNGSRLRFRSIKVRGFWFRMPNCPSTGVCFAVPGQAKYPVPVPKLQYDLHQPRVQNKADLLWECSRPPFRRNFSLNLIPKIQCQWRRLNISWSSESSCFQIFRHFQLRISLSTTLCQRASFRCHQEKLFIPFHQKNWKTKGRRLGHFWNWQYDPKNDISQFRK